MKKISIANPLLRYTCAALMALGLSACAEDPDVYDLFIGSYKGKVSYTNTSENKYIRDTDGKVTIVKVGTRHDFNFSSGIPSIRDVKIQNTDGKTFKADILGDFTGHIKIENNHLDINYIKGLLDEVWKADCSRD